MAYNSLRHDIGITNVGSAGAGTALIGMMLAQTPDGTPAYAEYDGKYLADQFFTGAPSQVNMNPEEELILSQDNWRSGISREYFDSTLPEKYFKSIGMDLRHYGMAIAGPTPTAISGFPVARATISNGDMEANSDWSGTGSQSDDRAHGGTYSWVCTTGNTAYQNAATWTDDWQGEYFRFECWVWCTVAGRVKISISDGQGTGDSSTNSLTSTWEKLTVTRQLHASASYLRVVLDASGATGGYFDDATLGSPGTVVAFAEFNDKLYAASGASVFELHSGGSSFTYVNVLPATITDLEPFTDDQLYIAQGFAANYWEMTTGKAFTINSASGTATYQFFETVHAAAPTMYGNDAANTLYKNTDPSETGANAWATRITVDSSYHSITDLLSKSGALYIMKEDMPYYLNSSDAVQGDLAPELKVGTSSTSGKNAYLWKNKIYIPFGAQGLLEIDGTTNTFLNPAGYCTNLSEYAGRVCAVAGDEEYLFAIITEVVPLFSNNIYIIAGREETISGTTSWVWHPIAEFAFDGECETAFVSNVYQKRLWISSNDSVDSLYYIPLPVGYGDIENDANRKFKTATYFETPFLHGGFKADDKAWIKITLTMGHPYNANRYFTVHYKTLDGSWTSIGNFTGASGNMVQSRFIDTTNKPFSSMMALKFTAVTDDTDYTPILLSYDVRAIMYPKIKRLIHCVVRCANEIVCKNGMIDTSNRATIKSTLDNARSNAVWPISIRDIDGSTLKVKFLPVPSSLQRLMITKKEKGRSDERHYHCLMMEVEGV